MFEALMAVLKVALHALLALLGLIIGPPDNAFYWTYGYVAGVFSLIALYVLVRSMPHSLRLFWRKL